MPQMSPSLWTFIAIYELFILFLFIFKIFFFSLNLKILPNKYNFKNNYYNLNWKWK